MSEVKKEFKIGCEIFIRKNDEILLGKRKNVFGDGSWALPGGHLEFGETTLDSICREVKEELNLDLDKTKLKFLYHIEGDLNRDSVQYFHFTFEYKYENEHFENFEPERCSDLKFFPVKDLPANLFEPHLAIFKKYLELCKI